MASEFDDVLDQEAAGSLPPLSSGLETGEFDDVLDTEVSQQQTYVRTVIDLASKDNPEAAAERIRLSQSTGLPPEVVARNQQELKRREIARAIDLQRMMRDSPILFRQMTDPTFTAAAIDDLDTLRQIEKSFTNIADYAKSGEMASDAGGAARSLALGATVGVGKMIFDVFGAATDLVGLDYLAGGYRTMSDNAREAMDAFGMQADTSTGRAIKSGLESAGQNLALLPLGLERGLFQTAEAAGAAVAGAMSVGVGADSYQRARGEGVGRLNSALYGINDAGVEFLMEKIPAGQLFKGIELDNSLLKQFAQQTVTEGWTEQVTTIAQDFNEWMALHPEKTTAEFLAERPEAAYQTFIATLIGTGVQTTAIAGINKLVEKASNQALVYEQDRLKRQLQLAGMSALRERSPEQFRANMAQVVANAPEGAPTEIHVDAEVLNQLAPEVQALLPESVRAQIPEALAMNATVPISMADVLTIAPGTELEQVLNDNARIGSPEAPSRVEAEKAAEFIQQDAERVLQQAQDQSAWQSEVDTVQQTIKDQLDQAGRFTSDVNEGYARLQSQFFSVMASRFGITPTEMYQRFSVKVAGQMGQGEVLNAGADQTQTPEFKNWFGESKAINAQGAPLVVYHGTPTNFTEFKRTTGKNATLFGTEEVERNAFFFSDHRQFADEFAAKQGNSGRVLELYLSMQRPADLRDGFPDAVVTALEERGFNPNYFHTRDMDNIWEVFDGQDGAEIVAALKDAGYDGAILLEAVDPSKPMRGDNRATTYAVFDPTQIKSVNNRGTFNPNDPNILKQSVSTRLPTAKKATENPLEAMLVIGLEAAKADPKAFEKNVELIRQYPNFRDNPSADTPDKAAEQFIRHVVDNLLWLHDQIPEDTRARAQLWYDGANAIATRWSEKYRLSDFQIAGVLAVLSPQKDWFQNVSLGERVLDIMSSKQDFTWNDEMSATAAGIPALNPEDVGEITGKMLGELESDYLQAMWVRVYDQTYNERGYRIVTPEGEFGDWVVNADGKTRSKTAWGSFNEIGKAISIFKDGSIANISASLGEQHKVRNFYNNIFSPNSAHGDVTIDTHAVAAALLRPLSGGSLEVMHNFGSSGAASSSVFGSKGTYGIYAEAYRRAAAQRGVLPRQMQSITWEAVRSLFTAGFKSQEANVAKIDGIWDQYRKRRISLDEARNQLFDAAGGISAFEWERPGDSAPASPWASSYTEELDSVRGAERAVGRGDRGVSPEPAAGAGVLEQQARGTFNPQTLLISLGPQSDLSTFLHESGHFFLEVMADLAALPDAPAQVREDMDKVLGWFGVPDLATWNTYTLDQKRPHHEKWAESFEQYLLEGKAPSAELQPLFRRFRAWLVNVYKSLTDFMRGRQLDINDEIRQVFDRLLATDAEIAQAEEQVGLLPDFDATNEAIERLQERSLRNLKWTLNARSKFLKQFTKEAKELRKGVLAEVLAEFEQRPDAIASRAIRKVRNKAGAERDAKIAVIADAAGYATVEEMMAAVEALGPVNDAVEAEVDRRMLERHGDLATEEAREQAANEAVHNEARARALAAELKSQDEAMNPRETTGRTDARGRPITVNALFEAARAFGADLATRRQVGKLKNAIYLHRAAEARAGKAWQTATQKGDTKAAVQAKRDQLLNHQAVRSLIDAQAEVRASIEFFRKVTKGNNEKLVKGGRDPDVVNAMRAILGAYGIAPRTGKGALEYMELVQKNDPAMYGVIAPSVTMALNNAKPFNELSVEEVRGLTDELKSLWHLAKRSRQMEIDGDLLDLEDLADQLYTRMEEIGIPDVLPGETGALTNAEMRRRNWLQQAPAILRRVEQWAEAKDGTFGGPFLTFIFQPVKIAADRYRADRLVYRQKFQALVDAIAPTMDKKVIAAPELGYTFGRGHNGIGMAELLHAILHTGNDSNKRKLLLGRNWAAENPDGTLDTSRWEAFLERMHDEGVLTKAHYDFAQGVWDLLEETKPLAQKTHRDVFGRYFAEVTANPVTTPFGTYRGGYVPAQADPLLVQEADQRELLETENAGMSYAFPATNRGFTKGRVEYNRPLKLDLRTLPQHIDKVLLFSHMEPAVRSVDRLLRRNKVAQTLNKIDPAAINGMLKPWLNRSARQTVETPVSADAGLNRMASQARARTGMALMMGNVSNTLQQITGFSTALLKVKGSHLRRAVAQYIADPKQLKDTVWSLSPYMADRASNEVAVLSDTLEAIVLNPSVYESGERFTRRHAYFLQTAMDNQMSPIIWSAAYNQALAEGMEDRMARRFADGVIRQTQGSTLPEDVSRIETGTAFARAFTQFVGYFNMLANTNATALQQIAREQGLRNGAGRAFGVLMLGVMIPIWVAELIANAFRGGPEDEDDDGYLDDWLAAVFGFGTIRGLLSGVPGIAQIGQSMVNRFNDNPADDRFSLSPTVSVLESAAGAPYSLYKAIADEGSAQKAVRDMSALITVTTGLPAMTLARPIGYAAGVAQGTIAPTGPVDAARGVITGTASPESKQP